MILFLIILLLAAIVLERWSIKHSLDGVKYDVYLSRSLVEIDERFEIVTSVRNTSRRFIPFIRLHEYVPRSIQMEARLYSVGFDENRARVSSTIYMMPRQKMTRRLTGSLGVRGRYLFYGATLYGGDFLGLSEKAKSFALLKEAVVLPKSLGSGHLEQTLGGYMGDISVNRFILEDPVLTLGFREYTGREPMKQISWPVTARTGRMMVKNYDHTLDITVTVVLNIDSALHGSACDPLDEICYSLTRGVCEELERRRISYAFCTNVISINQMGAWEYVSDGLGGSHLMTILEGLGRASYRFRSSRESLMEDVRRRAESGRAHIVITPTRQDFSRQDMLRLEDFTGTKALVLTAEEVRQA